MIAVPNRLPGRPRSAEAEKAILDATIELLVARGLAGLSVEAVAARAGVAKTTIYRRWPDKEELILAAVTAAKGPPPQPPGHSVRDDLLHLLLGVGRGGRRQGAAGAAAAHPGAGRARGGHRPARPRAVILRPCGPGSRCCAR